MKLFLRYFSTALSMLVLLVVAMIFASASSACVKDDSISIWWAFGFLFGAVVSLSSLFAFGAYLLTRSDD